MENKAKSNPENKINKVDATPTSLFFQYNTALGIMIIIIAINYLNNKYHQSNYVRTSISCTCRY